MNRRRRRLARKGLRPIDKIIRRADLTPREQETAYAVRDIAAEALARGSRVGTSDSAHLATLDPVQRKHALELLGEMGFTA